MSISHDTLRKIGASEDSIRLPPESGGGYMGALEVFHQIHCVVGTKYSSQLTLGANTICRTCSGRARTQIITKISRLRGQTVPRHSDNIWVRKRYQVLLRLW